MGQGESFAVMVEIEQRTHEWNAFRAKHIGASDACIISGHSPWKSALQLWMEKTGKIPIPDTKDNFAIQRGIRLEPMVRAMSEIYLDRTFSSPTFRSKTHPHLSVSLDCYDSNFNEHGEIKIGGFPDHKKLFTAEESTPSNIIIPKKYYPQIQQQMFVMETDFSYYISYHLPKGAEDWSGDLRIVKVYRDDGFLSRYLPVADIFYSCLIENKPPPVSKVEI